MIELNKPKIDQIVNLHAETIKQYIEDDIYNYPLRWNPFNLPTIIVISYKLLLLNQNQYSQILRIKERSNNLSSRRTDKTEIEN